jgi:hypothetical protein
LFRVRVIRVVWPQTVIADRIRPCGIHVSQSWDRRRHRPSERGDGPLDGVDDLVTRVQEVHCLGNQKYVRPTVEHPTTKMRTVWGDE